MKELTRYDLADHSPALAYGDILLVPQYSDIATRKDTDLLTRLSRNYTFETPLIATPMDTVCEAEMAIEMLKLGGVGIIHRFMSIEDQVEDVQEIFKAREKYEYKTGRTFSSDPRYASSPIVAAIGANGDNIERAFALIENGVNVLLIDVAHGHHINVHDTIKKLKEADPYSKDGRPIDIIAGSIATPQAARDLCEWGADGVRVGIGGGSICTTRIETGHGVPNVTSIASVARICEEYDIPVMTDGGIRSAGDIAKAIACGADNVMLGRLLAGTEESPGGIIEQQGRKGIELYKRYRGSASLETKVTHGQSQRNVEGVSSMVSFQGPVKFVFNRLTDGLRSALSYSGCRNLHEFQRKAKFQIITPSGMAESVAHINS